MRGSHARYPGFFEFGDADAYQHKLDTLRRQLARVDVG